MCLHQSDSAYGAAAPHGRGDFLPEKQIGQHHIKCELSCIIFFEQNFSFILYMDEVIWIV